MLARQLGDAARRSLHNDPGSAHSTRDTADALANWYGGRGSVGQPWLGAPDMWRIVVGDLVLFRADPTIVRSVWPLVEKIEGPETALQNRNRVQQIAALAGKPGAADAVFQLAERFSPPPSGAAELQSMGVPESQARLAAMASPASDDDIMFSGRGVLRVVARFFGSRVDRENQRSAGRIETARLVGAGDHERLSNLALVELARTVCLPEQPRCSECPLQESCCDALASGRGIQARIL